MKIVSFITETDVVRKILKHLELWEERAPVERPPPAEIPERHYESFDDGWSACQLNELTKVKFNDEIGRPCESAPNLAKP